jgi:hypothetical protein
MERKSFREWFPLFASVASFIASIVIPLIGFVMKPVPFSASMHYESLSLPPSIAKSWLLPTRVETRANYKAKSPSVSFDPPQEVLIVTVVNAGTAARHNVNMTTGGLSAFAGVELGPLTPSTVAATSWRSPDFREESATLIFPPISTVPAETTFQTFVWGRYGIFGPHIEVRSDEGLGSISVQTALSGWSLFVGLNAWWMSTIICVAAGLWFLGQFRRQHK